MCTLINNYLSKAPLLKIGMSDIAFYTFNTVQSWDTIKNIICKYNTNYFHKIFIGTFV